MKPSTTSRLSIKQRILFVLILPFVSNIAFSSEDINRTMACEKIKHEIAKQQCISVALASPQASPLIAIALISKSKLNISDMESQASSLGCNTAISKNALSTTASAPSFFEKCFTLCMQVANKTKAQCFEHCSK